MVCVAMMAVVSVLLSCLEGTNAFSCRIIPRLLSTTRITSLNSSSKGRDEDGSSVKASMNIRAAVYQPPIPNNDEKTLAEENPLTILTKITDVLQLASQCSIDVVQFPELFLNGGGKTPKPPMDRESYVLNIIGNLCADLNVACVVGYAEAMHESESSNTAASSGCYNSLAIFHADGSRAGNYRCVHPGSCDSREENTASFAKGHPLVETTPISLKLPEREEPTKTTAMQEIIKAEQYTTAAKVTTTTREIKVGAMCGGDLLMPEHARHLARSGAELLVVSGSLEDDKNSYINFRVAQHVLPTRCMENELPLLFSNYVDDDDEVDGNISSSFIGQSAIMSSDGVELVRAPKSLNADMPSDKGYFLPCETAGGALYAADLDVRCGNDKSNLSTSIESWDITPRIDGLGGDDKKGETTKTSKKGFQIENQRKTKGFGKQVLSVLEQRENTI